MLTVPAHTRTYWATALVLAVLAVLWPLLGESDLSLVGVGLGYAVAAVGVDIATGYAGQPNFGQSAFMAIGAYAAAWLENSQGLSLWQASLCAIILCALLATLLGLAAVRLEHLGFGIVTFAFAFVAAAFLQGGALSDITGGPNGTPSPAGSLFGYDVTQPRTLYGVALVVLIVATFLSHNFVRSRAGRAMLTVKGNEKVAAVLGVDATSVKLRAFALSAAFGGAGGVLIAISAGFVTPASFPPAASVTLFGMVALGGVGTITGPILGAMFFWLVPSYAPGLEAKQTVFIAAVFLLVLVVLPSGVFGTVADLVARRRPKLRWARPLGPARGQPARDVRGDDRLARVGERRGRVNVNE